MISRRVALRIDPPKFWKKRLQIAALSPKAPQNQPAISYSVVGQTSDSG